MGESDHVQGVVKSKRVDESAVRMANSNLALPQQVGHKGPKARLKTTEPMDPTLLKAKMV